MSYAIFDKARETALDGAPASAPGTVRAEARVKVRARSAASAIPTRSASAPRGFAEDVVKALETDPDVARAPAKGADKAQEMEADEERPLGTVMGTAKVQGTEAGTAPAGVSERAPRTRAALDATSREACSRFE